MLRRGADAYEMRVLAATELPPGCGWLKIFVASTRTCRLFDSAILTDLLRARSAFQVPGP